MDGLGVSCHGGFFEGFSQGWVGVAGTCDVFAACTVFNGQGSFSNHLTGVGADDVDTEDAVGLGISDEFDLTFRVEVGLCSGVGAEWEGSDSVFDAGSLDFGFVLANPGDFRVGIHDAGDSGVVNVPVALFDIFDGSDGLFFGLVGQHGTESAVTDNTDVRSLGAIFLVNHQSTLVVSLEANIFKTEAFGVWSTSNSDEDNVRIKGLFLASLSGLNLERNIFAAGITAGHLCSGEEFQALPGEDLLSLLCDLSIHTGSTDLAKEFDNGDFSTKSRPNGSLRLI